MYIRSVCIGMSQAQIQFTNMPFVLGLMLTMKFKFHSDQYSFSAIKCIRMEL